MSNESNKHELLSAYFDGELSPEDRQRAERMLEESVDARRDIDGVAELSELVKSLPTEPAPAELLSAVMRQAERDTLLPTNNAPPVASKVGSRSWMTVIGGIAATAAAVLVTVQMLPTMTSSPSASSVADVPPGGTIVADNQTIRFGDERREFSDSSPPPMAFDKSSLNEQVAFGIGGPPTAESPTADAPAGARPEMARSFKRGAASPAPAESKSAGRLAGREAESVPQQPGNGGAPAVAAKEAFSFNADVLQNARQGDVLPFFITSGTKVTTFMVTVVDVKQALNQMQVLLARNDIPAHMIESDGEADDKSATERKPKFGNKIKLAEESASKSRDTAKQTERLFAVYVETTPDRFTSALKDLLHDKIFAELHPKPPVDELQIEVAELGRSRRQLFRRLDSTIGDEQKSDVAEQRLSKKSPALAKTSPAGKGAPADSPQPLYRKSKALGQTKSPKGGKKALPKSTATKSVATKPIQRSRAVEKENVDKLRRRTESTKRFADTGNDGFSSYQLRVRLARLPMAAEQENQKVIESRADEAGKPTANTSRPARDRALYEKTAKAEKSGVAPVRVLFVFRQAAKKTTP
jgi:hypothetical protein